jgi:hypothetical protein
MKDAGDRKRDRSDRGVGAGLHRRLAGWKGAAVTEPGNEVEEWLQGLSRVLGRVEVASWPLHVIETLTAALRAAVGQHQPVESNHVFNTPEGQLTVGRSWHCAVDGQWWPCDTVKDVLAELEEL